MVLVYGQGHDKLGEVNFEPMWYSPFTVKCVLTKEAYELVNFNVVHLSELRNGIYLKKYFV